MPGLPFGNFEEFCDLYWKHVEPGRSPRPNSPFPCRATGMARPGFGHDTAPHIRRADALVTAVNKEVRDGHNDPALVRGCAWFVGEDGACLLGRFAPEA